MIQALPDIAANSLPMLCVDCRNPMTDSGGAEVWDCPGCGRRYAERGGILRAMGALSGKNRIAEAFYNSARFENFRFWEQLFLWYAGGLRGARLQILRHLPSTMRPSALDARPAPAGSTVSRQQPSRSTPHMPGSTAGGSLLEVGIGDGDNVRLLPEQLRIAGIDIALGRLETCRHRFQDRRLRLALAEAEHIPFADGLFDAVLCVGGFNFFSDPVAALREMARVARPGGRIVVADEIPDFHRYGWGHRIRVPALDRWLMTRWFGPEFRDMVLGSRLDIEQIARDTLVEPQIHRIWRGYGYCIVGSIA